MSHEHETATSESETSPAKLSAIGGFIGAILGSRRGTSGTIAGGLVGGTLGYVTGAILRSSTGEHAVTVESDPVAIDVADPETERDGDANPNEDVEETEADDEGGSEQE